MNTSEILERAKSLIDKPEKWSKGLYARAGIRSVPVWDGRADRFCAIGACKRAAFDEGDEFFSFPAQALLDDTSFDINGHCTISFNDAMATTHADIMKLYDEAIWRALLQEGKVFPLNQFPKEQS